MNESDDLRELCINTIRMLSVDAVEQAKSGHPGTPMEAAAMMYELWTRFLRYNPQNPDWPNRDRFVLSAGHASMLLYSLLYLTGYDLPLEELKRFRQFGSRTPGHPEYGHAPGVEMTTGPLGQGFAAGVGMAIAERYLAEYFNRPGHTIVDYRIYAYCSDGDLMEGVASEAASLAGHLRLNKLIYMYGDNHITIDGETSLTFTEGVGERFRAYNWFVQEIEGNDLPAFAAAIERSKAEHERPSLIIARTHIGYGSPGKQDKSAAHGAPLGADEVRRTKENLQWPLDPPFHVPEEALARFREAVPRGTKLEDEWNQAMENYEQDHPDLARQWKDWRQGRLPADWQETLPDFSEEKSVATRTASGRILQALSRVLPNLVVGSADLAESTNLMLKDGGSFGREKAGRNIHFGIREHCMGAVLNGLALSKMLIPAGSTFLVFSDYMKPAIRIAALMRAHTTYVYTHDSIGLGEDGPTHEPVEHLASLRAIPNMTVIRPADAAETAVAWQLAITRNKGPVALILTRQKVPVINRRRFASAEGVWKGGYILADAPMRKPVVILIATGSEVSVATEAWERLNGEEISTRLVSLPSWEIFEEQPQDYRDMVLPPAVRARVAVEAASAMGWERYAGDSGAVVAMRGFGASAPYEVLMKEFGFTAENIVQQARSLVGKK